MPESSEPLIPHPTDASSAAEAITSSVMPELAGRTHFRYRLGKMVQQRNGREYYQGDDSALAGPRAVWILRRLITEPAKIAGEQTENAEQKGDSAPTWPDLDLARSNAKRFPTAPLWPTLNWDETVLRQAVHPCVPRVLDRFQEDGIDWLVLEAPQGPTLRAVWNDPQTTTRERFGWLIQIVEAVEKLFLAGGFLLDLSADRLVLSPTRQPVLADLSDLVPVPVPVGLEWTPTPRTAPELLQQLQFADARSLIFLIGALIRELFLGRELTSADFVDRGWPIPFAEAYPDADPHLVRLISKTFAPEAEWRFGTREIVERTGNGFTELTHFLEFCQRHFERVRLDVSTYTSTGMLRAGNEDAVAVLHHAEARLDETDEFCLVLLCDGMGGMECGEVAAALAIQVMRQQLMNHPPFNSLLAGGSLALRNASKRLRESGESIAGLLNDPTGAITAGLSGVLRRARLDDPSRSIEVWKDRLVATLAEANRQVYLAARNGLGHPGMGCTAEVVYIDGRKAVIGHVGDSRTYLWRDGKLSQITRDQTLVNRLVELGLLTEEEALYHPRRAELQQAIGGRIDVEPETYAIELRIGDWLLICSDGLTNQIRNSGIRSILEHSHTAEQAARRLVNLANLYHAQDNVTVAVVRLY